MRFLGVCVFFFCFFFFPQLPFFLRWSEFLNKQILERCILPETNKTFFFFFFFSTVKHILLFGRFVGPTITNNYLGIPAPKYKTKQTNEQTIKNNRGQGFANRILYFIKKNGNRVLNLSEFGKQSYKLVRHLVIKITTTIVLQKYNRNDDF